MSDYFESLKFEMPKRKESKNVELIKKYIEVEKELCRQYDEEDGVDITAEDYKPQATVTLNRISSFLKYREVRVEEAYISKMNSNGDRKNRMIMLNELDHRRRETHNLALVSLRGLVEFAKKNNLEPIYSGPLLSEEDINSHNPNTYDVRMEMTDFFLALLVELGNYSLSLCKNQETRKDLSNLQRKMDKVTRDYGIKKELLSDDDDIVFEDELERYDF